VRVARVVRHATFLSGELGRPVRGGGAPAVGSWLSARVGGDPEDAWWGDDVCVCCG
jgi:hypothetical protein